MNMATRKNSLADCRKLIGLTQADLADTLVSIVAPKAPAVKTRAFLNTLRAFEAGRVAQEKLPKDFRYAIRLWLRVVVAFYETRARMKP